MQKTPPTYPLDRTVRKIESTPSKSQQDELQPFSAYDKMANIVLLGDPGAGKTCTFRQSAARCRGHYTTARAFLVTPAAKFGGTLFIDGLDEKRGGRSDRDTVDALVKALFATGACKVRISCRIADWLGDSDLAALNPYFEQSGDPVVLQLGCLSGDEQRVVLQANGLSATETDEFLREATERVLGDFLENPQNLIMLFRAVQAGTWPTTRKELFELATELMLKEFDKNHTRSGSGIYTVEELRPAAGAACASRLISDIEAISLADHEDSAAIPSYRSLSMIAPERTIAALGRRVFVGGPAPESVDYAHRTTAEYLGAAWLAEVVRNGMPFGRLQALLGIDGHPAPELRGLHAWLAVHLPEHADRLIDADPYGVLTYGDPASLPQSSCAHLVKALGRLSQTDPWFRSGNWQAPGIAALSRIDMVEEFRAVLRSNNAGFGVRSIIVEAAAQGAPLPALKDDLANVVLRSQSPYAERLHALNALVRIGPDGKAAAGAAFQKLGTDIEALRLRAEMIRQMYGEGFGAADIAALLRDLAASASREGVIHVLYMLSEHMPLADIPMVLDELPQADLTTRPSRENEREVARFINRVLVRAWPGIPDIEPASALRWLLLRHSYLSGYGRSQSDQLRMAILDRKDLLRDVADHFFGTMIANGNFRLQLSHFCKATFLVMTPAELLVHMRTHMARTQLGSEKELFFYEAALGMAFGINGPEADAAIEALFSLADDRADLRAVRDGVASCGVPSGYFHNSPRDQSPQSLEELRAKFEREADTIRNGGHLSWLIWAAQVYFGLFSDDQAKPVERLVTVLGEANAKTAIAGFIASLSRPDLPSMVDVVKLLANHQRRNWWYVLAAGLTERWDSSPNLTAFSDDFLKTMLVFDLTNPGFEQVNGTSRVVIRCWKAALMTDRPELVRDAYIAIARAKLANGDQIADGLCELMAEDAFKPYRGEIALQFLSDFPNANPLHLDRLFNGAFATPAAHTELLAIADRFLAGATSLGQQQHDKWLAAAYMLSSSRYEAKVGAIAEHRPRIVFELRDRSFREAASGQPRGTLTVEQLEFLVRVTGTQYPEIGFPSNGWSGDTNAWDAAEYCRRLINALSAIPSQAASDALRRLEADTKLESYNPHLRHALASQEKGRREMEYDRPDWLSTIKALSNGPPATVADLHALVIDQIVDLGARIARENTDIYKSFWNLDHYSRPEAPRPEEACRDTLITLLRPPLAPKGIMVEPEGHMVADKRADISVAMPRRKILCELKRHYHRPLDGRRSTA